MPEWAWIGGSQAIADCGPYIGPWPVLGPGKLAAIRGMGNVGVSYITSIPDPSGDPARYDWQSDLPCWITYANGGTTFDGTGYRLPDYWRYAVGPNYNTFAREPSRAFPGIHLFVLLDHYPGTTLPDPLDLVPSTYVAGGRGARPDAGGKWSAWLPGLPTPIRTFQGFTNRAQWNLRSAFIEYHGTAGESWSSVIAHARSMLFDSLAAGNVTTYAQGLPSLISRTSRAGFLHNSDGTKTCFLHAYQEANLLMGTYFGDPKILSIQPVNFYDYVPFDNADNVHNFGASDPYTLNGDGYQYDPALDPVPLHFIDNTDGGITADGFTQGLPPATAIPHMSMRLSAHPSPWGPTNRDEWLFTGDLYDLTGSWFADDEDTIVLADLDLDPGPGTGGTSPSFVNLNDLPRPYSMVQNTADIWLVCQPSFALPDGPDPAVPPWVVDTPGTSGSVYYASVFAHRGTNYDPFYAFSDISLLQQMPRWRYWIPAGGELGVRGSDRPPIIFW